MADDLDRFIFDNDLFRVSVSAVIENVALYSTVLSRLFGSSSPPITGLKGVWDYAGTFAFVSARGEIAHSLAFCVCFLAISVVWNAPWSLHLAHQLGKRRVSGLTRVLTYILSAD